MLPKESIQFGSGFEDLYLIEARSIGGVSGAPVFVRETWSMEVTRKGEKSLIHVAGDFKLLGLMRGNWDIAGGDINKVAMRTDPKRGVNIGIAAVVPASKILEVLNQPALAAIRADREARAREQTAPTDD